MNITNNTYEALVESIEQAEKLASKPSMTPTEVRQHSTLLAKISILKLGVDPQTLNAARANSLRRELGMRDDAPVGRVSDEYREAFREFVRTGKAIEVRTDSQHDAEWGRPSGASYVGGDLAGGTTSGKAGGYLTAPEFLAREATMNLGAYDSIVDPYFSSIVMTDTGNVAPVPVFDDLQGSPAAFVQSRLVDDTTQDSQGTSLIGAAMSDKAIFGKAFKYQSAIPMALELESDGAAVLAVLLPQVFKQRHQMALGNAAINGSGVGQPLGLATVAATLTGGNVVTSTSNSKPTLLDFQKCLRAMPRPYRREAVFYVNSDTFIDINEFLDTANRADQGGTRTVVDRPIAVCDSLASLGAGKLVAVLAVPRMILQRRVRQDGIGVERFCETQGYVERGMCLLKSYVRADFMPLLYDSNSAPYIALYLSN